MSLLIEGIVVPMFGNCNVWIVGGSKATSAVKLAMKPMFKAGSSWPVGNKKSTEKFGNPFGKRNGGSGKFFKN